MSKIFLAGDVHMPHDVKKLMVGQFPEQKNMTKDDYLIVLGDFGLLWKNIPDKEELYWIKNLQDRNFTTLWIDGNHENHERIEQLPTKKMFGSEVGVVADSIYHLRRGHIYDIIGKKFFTMGGAMSVDKEHRTTGISWWENEIPSYKEMYDGLDRLDLNNNKVDFILTHTCPNSVMHNFLDPQWYSHKIDDPASKYLDEILNRVDFKSWYFGHFHVDKSIEHKKGGFHCLYNESPTKII